MFKIADALAPFAPDPVGREPRSCEKEALRPQAKGGAQKGSARPEVVCPGVSPRQFRTVTAVTVPRDVMCSPIFGWLRSVLSDVALLVAKPLLLGSR
jgi:hypothetical protein